METLLGEAAKEGWIVLALVLVVGGAMGFLISQFKSQRKEVQDLQGREHKRLAAYEDRYLELVQSVVGTFDRASATIEKLAAAQGQQGEALRDAQRDVTAIHDLVQRIHAAINQISSKRSES